MTMKLNKSKGKVHPSPSSSSSSSSSSFSLSSSSSSNSDPVSSLDLLLPAAILTLISVLSLQDREVLAYMITRSLKSAANNPASILDDNSNRKRKPKKSGPPHKSPTFDCGCFECYTSYWFRWDSSPHRELIHQAIEAFEEHLAATEQPKKTPKSKAKPRRREKDKDQSLSVSSIAASEPEEILIVEPDSPESIATMEVGSPEKEETSPGSDAGEEVAAMEEREVKEEVSGSHNQQQQQHKGLARKVLPDVIGLFNSRLWNLWGPNV